MTQDILVSLLRHHFALRNKVGYLESHMELLDSALRYYQGAEMSQLTGTGKTTDATWDTSGTTWDSNSSSST